MHGVSSEGVSGKERVSTEGRVGTKEEMHREGQKTSMAGLK